MRFLCLHGMGTNAQIFEAQISRIMHQLEAEGHEFVFLDGFMECEPTPDIKEVYPPPYLAFYTTAHPDLVEDAQAYVLDVIEEEGPFDAVIGFSQGAALAASLILEHHKQQPLTDLFKLAVFICATLPFNRDDLAGLASWRAAKVGGPAHLVIAGEFAGEVERTDALGFPNDLSGIVLGRYHPLKTPGVGISVPSIHVLGGTDEYLQQGQLLAEMCSGDDGKDGTKVVIEHSDGHRVSKDTKTINHIVKSIRSMVKKVEFAGVA